MRCNDNSFVFNRMFGYNPALYDIRTKDWYWDKINPRAATCYKKFDHDHFECIQPLRSDNDIITIIKDDGIIIPRESCSISSSFRGYCEIDTTVVYSCNVEKVKYFVNPSFN